MVPPRAPGGPRQQLAPPPTPLEAQKPPASRGPGDGLAHAPEPQAAGQAAARLTEILVKM